MIKLAAGLENADGSESGEAPLTPNKAAEICGVSPEKYNEGLWRLAAEKAQSGRK